MISLELTDSMVYNGIEDTIKKFIIKKSCEIFVLFNNKILSEIDDFIPIDTEPSRTPEEFLDFIETLEKKDEYLVWKRVEDTMQEQLDSARAQIAINELLLLTVKKQLLKLKRAGKVPQKKLK